MASLQIVIVNDFGYVNGGASQVALMSSQALARRGHAVKLFCAVAPIVPDLAAAGVDVICCNHSEILRDANRVRAAIRGIWNRTAGHEFRKLLDSLDPSQTVIHVHGWTKALTSSIFRVALRKQFKLVLTAHDYFIACPNGGFFNYQNNEICQLRPLSLACILSNCDRRHISHKLWRSVRQVVQKRWGHLPNRLNHLITISDLSRSVLDPFFSANTVLHPVANPIFVDRQEPVNVKDNRSYTAVGRIDQHKGALLLAKAAQIARVDIVFAGEGECRDAVLEICPSVEVTGWLSHEQVVGILSRSRVLVFPSLWYETQGLVVLEAAALGVPAIVPDTCAAREMVSDGVTGLWFRGGDVNDLARKMRIFRDGQLAQRMGRAAYERYWDRPSTVDCHVDSLEKVYHEVLGVSA